MNNLPNIDELVAELARIHGTVLSPDDPVAMMITINRFLAREFAAHLDKLLQEFREALATSSSDWQHRINKRAEAVINGTIMAAKTAVSSGAESGLAEGLPPFLQAFEAATRRTEGQLRQLRRFIIALSVLVSLLIVALIATCCVLVLHR